MNIRSLKLGASIVAMTMGWVSAPAMAQTAEAEADASAAADVDQASDGQAIVVTGSRIGRRDFDTASPVAVVQQEEFKLSGTVNVENVINSLPQVVPGASSFSNNPGGGIAALDLRGLGAPRTLVLVNGRRWMFFDASQTVDLNTIPAFLLEGVDVVTGGASAVYGSDALAGVVNFRLRNDLNGIEVGGQYSLAGKGDGARYEASLALGTDLGGGAGHATVFMEYFRRKSIYAGDRSFGTSVLGDDGEGGFAPGGSSTTPQGRFISTLSTDDCPTGNIYCGPAGAFYESPGVSRPRLGTDLYNFGPVNYLMVPQERYLAGGYGDYDIGGGNTVYAEVSFVNNRVANELAATPVTGTFQVDIATVSPFISASDIAALQQLDGVASSGNTVGDGIVPLSISRRIIESGSRNSLDERNAFRVLAGIRGPIGDRFNYDAYYSYARTRNSNIQSGNISRSAVQAGLDGTGTPINIFGPGTLTPEMVDQISILAQNSDISVLQTASASISGSLFNFGMDADDVGVAIGGEYRKMHSEFIPDTALSSGDVIGFNAGDPTAGSYNVKEIFGEVRIPVVAERPGVYKLEFTGAARYSDYSLNAIGGVWTYAGGMEYAPISDVTFRGQYQRAVRAPNVAELFGGQAQGFPAAIDPCAVASAATDPTIRDLCIATGVPAAAVGDPNLQPNVQIQALFGGNPDLQEEVSDSYTAGIVVRPSFLPGFTATLDYYNIKVKGAIAVLGGGLANTLNLCYNVIQDLNSQYCQVFQGTRNALGVMDGTNPPAVLNANTGKLATEGLDLELDYRTDLPFSITGDGQSKLNLFFLGTYTKHATITPVQELPDQFNECAGKFGVLVCGNPRPKYKWTSRASWIDGPITTSVRWRHLASVTDDDPDTTYSVEKIGAYDLFDLSFAFDVGDHLSLSAGVNNIFDKKPPLLGDNQEQTNTYPSTYDVIGRDFFVSAKLAF